MAKIGFHYLGCRLNEAENESLARALIEAGHEVVEMDASPDGIVLNTCGVTAEAMRKSRNLMRRFASQNLRVLFLMGCAIDLMRTGEHPVEDEELVSASTHENACPSENLKVVRIYREDRPNAAKIILSTLNAFESQDSKRGCAIGGAADAVRGVEETPAADGDRVMDHRGLMTENSDDFRFNAENAKISNSDLSKYKLRMRCFIKIEDGCNNQCTYCSVRLARGRERSLSSSSILTEIQKCYALGEREFVLTGVQLGAWKEGERRLPDLIRDILEQTSVSRLRLSSIEPWHLRPELYELWHDKRLCPHFHSPVQSGSDAVLTAMRRRTPLDVYEEKIADIRRQIPQVRISTDLIVGFPGETESMWRETMDFIERIEFDDIHLFRFSPRPGTLAATMANPVPADIKRARWNEAHTLMERIRAQKLEAFKGSLVRVLWESCEESVVEGKRRWSGYSENYLRLYRFFDADKAMRGTITAEIFGDEDILSNLVHSEN